MAYGLWRLRLSMLGTLALVIGVSSLIISVLLSLIGAFSILTMLSIVILFSIVQWLIAPYMINFMYKVKEVPYEQSPKLHTMVEEVAKSANLPKPKVMYSPIKVPNAFAYGSPLGGSRVCITQGLLDNLNEDEIKAVLGHELGHLKHKDVQIMMFVSVLPTLFYWLGYSMMWSSMFSGGRNRNGGNLVLIGLLSLAVYFVLNLLVLAFSRQRELYADRHGAEVVENGAKRLSMALAKLDAYAHGMKRINPSSAKVSGFKSMLIMDPDSTSGINPRNLDDDSLLQNIASRKISTGERILGLFSTHPNTVTRIKILLSIAKANEY
ncbi:MAG: zinc metalloprotease HtpX [Nitrososphaerota archaeon]